MQKKFKVKTVYGEKAFADCLLNAAGTGIRSLEDKNGKT